MKDVQGIWCNTTVYILLYIVLTTLCSYINTIIVEPIFYRYDLGQYDIQVLLALEYCRLKGMRLG